MIIAYIAGQDGSESDWEPTTATGRGRGTIGRQYQHTTPTRTVAMANDTERTSGTARGLLSSTTTTQTNTSMLSQRPPTVSSDSDSDWMTPTTSGRGRGLIGLHATEHDQAAPGTTGPTGSVHPLPTRYRGATFSQDATQDDSDSDWSPQPGTRIHNESYGPFKGPRGRDGIRDDGFSYNTCGKYLFWTLCFLSSFYSA